VNNTYKKLEDIAGRYKQLTLTYMLSGYSRPVYRTGNLYKRISSFNSISSMIKSRGEKSVIVLNYSPPQAEYGKYVHDGTSRIKKRPFSEMAAIDPSIQLLIDNYTQSEMDNQIELIGVTLDDAFRTITLLK